MLIIVGGPAGCGKSTVGSLLSEKLNATFLEGDRLHPQANVDKMSNGIPLTDDDRWDWLKAVAHEGAKSAEENQDKLCVATCSCLKKAYRDHIRREASNQQVVFIFIAAEMDELIRRVNQRKNHFMKAGMIQSQLDIMEVPKDNESNCIVFGNNVDIDECTSKIERLRQ